MLGRHTTLISPIEQKTLTKITGDFINHSLLIPKNTTFTPSPLEPRAIARAKTNRTAKQIEEGVALYEQGMAHLHGSQSNGYEVSEEKARAFFTRAALKGNKHARAHLALMLKTGRGGKKDIERAKYWLKLAK